MNTVVVNVKVNPKVKKDAQKVAEKLGLSLSSLINGYLRQLIKTETVTFSLKEEPSQYMIQALKESKADIKAGRVSQSFDNSKDAIAYLDHLIDRDKKSQKN